jgi:hypothetical protein
MLSGPTVRLIVLGNVEHVGLVSRYATDRSEVMRHLERAHRTVLRVVNELRMKAGCVGRVQHLVEECGYPTRVRRMQPDGGFEKPI